MRALKIAAMLPWLLLISGVLMAATQYGEATVEKGAMTVIREGKTLKFEESAKAVPINEQDLIRVRANSLVQLKSREKATITLGSNAVFEVKPWQSHGSSGFLRALFGRFRSVVAGLSGGEQFNVKTATATIGVKGTTNRGQVNNRGGSLLYAEQHTTFLHGQTGGEQEVGQGNVSLTLNFNPPTPPAPAPPAFLQLFQQNLDSPPANGNEGGNFTGQDILVNNGIVTQDDLDSGQGNGGGEGGGGGGQGYTPPAANPNPNAGNEATQRAHVPLSFQ
jgi:FecR protein